MDAKSKLKILGIGQAVPKTIVTNFDIETITNGTNAEWINIGGHIPKVIFCTSMWSDDNFCSRKASLNCLNARRFIHGGKNKYARCSIC